LHFPRFRRAAGGVAAGALFLVLMTSLFGAAGAIFAVVLAFFISKARMIIARPAG
jgi:hypothetical protein